MTIPGLRKRSRSTPAVPFGWQRATDAGLTFRHVVDADMPFLVAVYFSTRIEELAATPWSEAQKTAFLEMQFRAQHADYTLNYPKADRLVVMYGRENIGRLYLDRTPRQHGILDIAFLPQHRGHGLGAALLRDLLDEARAAGKTVEIYVEKLNPAMRLYCRLGFKTEEDVGVYERMRWTPT